MWGIAGWVSYRQDVRRRRDVLAAMTDLPVDGRNHRESDAVFLTERIALGHRRPSVVDLTQRQPPMAAREDGRDLAAVTFSGELSNSDHLRAELSSLGYRFTVGGDTEIVLAAYLLWGESFLDRLDGMYAFALWDPRTGELLLVRDRMGLRPLHYRSIDGGVVFGSEPKAILASGLAEPVVDADGLRELLGYVKTPGTTYFQGIKEVRPGCLVRVSATATTEHRYWGLAAREHTDDLEQTIQSVRELVERAVTRDLDSAVRRCLPLSGGLDSSVIVALARRAEQSASDSPLRTFAVEFAEQTENFRADAERDGPDGPYVREMVAHVGCEHTDIVLDTAALTDPANRMTALTACDAPPLLGDLYTSLHLLFSRLRRSTPATLSGDAADEVFGGYFQFHDQRIIDTPAFPWLAGATKADSGFGFLLAPDVAARLDLPTYVADRYADALGEVPRLHGEPARERRMREVSYLFLSRFLPMMMDRRDRMATAAGLRVRVPFCDHRLVQYVFNTPWSMRSFDGREKSLLRAATRDLVPTSIAERRKSPYPAIQDPEYHAFLQREVAALVADGTGPALPLFDRDVLRTLVSAPPGTAHLPRVPLELVLNLNSWLEHYRLGVTA